MGLGLCSGLLAYPNNYFRNVTALHIPGRLMGGMHRHSVKSMMACNIIVSTHMNSHSLTKGTGVISWYRPNTDKISVGWPFMSRVNFRVSIII